MGRMAANVSIWALRNPSPAETTLKNIVQIIGMRLKDPRTFVLSPFDHIARYAEFGDWLQGCYKEDIKRSKSTKPPNNSTTMSKQPLHLSQFQRLWTK